MLLLRMLRAPGMSLALSFGLVYLAGALFFHVYRREWVGDAISRTANAMYVVFSRDPHLGAIGFVWLPGPTVIQLPLVLLMDLFHIPLFAGNLMSVLCSVATLLVLYGFLRDMGVSRGWRIALLVPYALHPMTLYYAVSGMSEAPFVLLVLIVVWQFTAYIHDRTVRPLFFGGMALAGAMWTRYEAIPLLLAVAIAITLYEVEGRDEGDPVPRTEAVLLTALSPAVLSFFMWLFFNAIITGDPLYFLNSSFGPTAQLKAFLGSQGPEVQQASKSLAAAVVFGVKRMLLASPLFLPLTAVVTGLAVYRRDWRLIGVLGIGGSQVVFAVYQLGTGGSFGWYRFFITAVPLTIVFAVVAVEPYRRTVRQRVYATVVAGMVIACGTAAYGFTLPTVALEEQPVVRHLFDPSYPDMESGRRRISEEMAAYIDRLPPGKFVYVETFQSWGVAATLRTRDRVVITNDRDSGVLLDDPVNQLDYILVPMSGGLAELGEIAQRFPGLYEFGAPWVELEREFKFDRGAWRLYRVLKGPEGTGEVPPPPAAPGGGT